MAAKQKPQKKPAKRRPARKRAPASLTDSLAEAAWADADLALAQALCDFDEIARAEGARARADALEMLLLSLMRAARKRGLSRLGEAGACVAFDPDLHELTGKPADKIEIVAPGVRRGDEVLVRARVRKAP